jgi:DNA polymerase elongation subunit (family B)
MSTATMDSAKNKYHGKRIMFPGTADEAKLNVFINQLPKRKDFIDQKAVTLIEKSIAADKNLLFLPNTLLEQQLRENKKMVYKLMLMGVMQGGAKAAVILNNIKVFFDVRVPEGVDPKKFEQAIRKAYRDGDIYCNSVEHLNMFPFKYFHEEPVPYLRIYFATVFARKKGITLVTNGGFSYFNEAGEEVIAENLETANDDLSCYYRKVAREYKFKLAGWNLIRKYKQAPSDKYTKENSYQYVFEVDVEDFIDIEKSSLDPKKLDTIIDIKKDKTMVMCWDMETDDLEPSGTAPAPEDVFNDAGEPRAVIELNCCSFFWQYDTNDILAVAISVMPSPPRDDCLIIQVKDQMDLIKVKALLVETMAPDIITGFNDGIYDWPFINQRAMQYDKIKKTKYVEFMKKHMSTIPYTPENAKWAIHGIKDENHIKLEADTSIDIQNFEVPGFICVDTRVVFRQLFPTAEKTSLNFFLAINKLGSKADMPYITMFKIFRLMRQLMTRYKTRDYIKIEANLKAEIMEHGEKWCPLTQNDANPAPKFDNSPYDVTKLNSKDILELIQQCTDVIHYCNVDARRCQELLNIRNVIPDKREVVNISYTSLYDGFYRAGGMKVRNLVIATAKSPEWNLAVSNKGEGNATKDKRKYPGAYVVPPKKGLYRDHKIVKRMRRKLAALHGINNNENTNIENIENNIGNINAVDYDTVNPQSEKFDTDLLNDDKWDLKVDVDANGAELNKTSNDDNDKCDRPCSGLDFSSLYPSLIMTFNLSPEKIVLDDAEAERLRLKGYRLHRIDFHYKLKDEEENETNRKTGWAVLHEPKCDDKGKWSYKGMGIYPHILKQLFDQRKGVKGKMDYYMAPKEYIEGIMKEKEFAACETAASQREFVRKYIDADIAKKQALVNENKGTRKEGYYAYQVKHVKEIDTFFHNEGFFPKPDQNQVGFEGITLQKLYPEVLFYFTYYNSKQLALKVFMNTFYGETGNSLSPFFLVQVAGGITTAGQTNLHKVKEFVEGNGYQVLYGDTDSLYISPPERYFEEMDAKYLSGEISKLQYWTEMIETTMEVMDNFKGEVNGMLRKDNGTPFLTMAYEEVLWPYAMVGKKKYLGVQHQGIVNLGICMPECKVTDFAKSKSLFVRGLEIKKRGCSEFLKQNVFECLKDVFCITQTMTLREIFEDKLATTLEHKWDPLLFIKTAAYKEPKPGKPGNPTVRGFVARMRIVEVERSDLGIKPPELGQRFNYIVAKRYPWKYGLRGTQQEIKQADKLEYFETLDNEEYAKYLGEKVEIDIDYYMLTEIIGQFARFAVYHPFYDKFGPNRPIKEWDDDDYKQADEQAVKYAKKLMKENYKAKFATQYVKRGKEFQTIFKNVNSKLTDWHYEVYGEAAVMFDITKTLTSAAGRIQTKDGETDFVDKHMKEALMKKILEGAEKVGQKDAIKRVTARIKKLSDARKKDGMNLYQLYNIYVTGDNAICKVQREVMIRRLLEEERTLRGMLNEYTKICAENTDVLEALVSKVRETAPMVMSVVGAGQPIDDTKKEFIAVELNDSAIANVDYTVIDRGLDYLRNTKKNYTKFNRNDINDLVSAIEGQDMTVEYEESEKVTEEDTPKMSENEERVEFIYRMFDNYTRIIAIKRTLYEINMMEEHLKHARKIKAHIVSKPPSVQTRSDVDDFSRFIKGRLAKGETPSLSGLP